MLVRHVGRFNTPKAQNVQNLFRDVLGMPNVTEQWGNFGEYTVDEARTRLDDLMTARGAIAHGDPDAQELSHQDVKGFVLLVVNLMIMTSSAARAHVKETTGKDMAERYAGQKVMFFKDTESGREFSLVLEVEQDNQQG